MSAKRSFDVQPKKIAGSTRSKKPAPKKRRRPEPKPERAPRRTSLRERREGVRRLQTLGTLAGIVFVCGCILYGLWRPEVRIQEISAPLAGNEAAVIKAAEKPLAGTYYVVFPRDSFFFYPEQEMKEVVLEAFPSVSKVKIARTGFTSLTLTLESRSQAFWWCGLPETAGMGVERCYEADESGYVFAAANTQTDSATGTLRVYAGLETGTSTASYPLRARVVGTEKIENILSFAKTIMALGTPVRRIAIREDEADLYTEGGTRITYVIGREKEAKENAEISLPTLNLMDGSVEYVDLRFADKVYLKRTSQE